MYGYILRGVSESWRYMGKFVAEMATKFLVGRIYHSNFGQIGMFLLHLPLLGF